MKIKSNFFLRRPIDGFLARRNQRHATSLVFENGLDHTLIDRMIFCHQDIGMEIRV